jgi:S-adenosylmethionine:tRNA ribosyltransferase-isomerase
VTTNLRLAGIRVRNETSIGVEAILVTKVSENSWRALIHPADRVDVGDRLRFGDTSENPACFLAFLDADVVEKHGENVLLSFHFTGGALDEALVRLGHASP